MVRLVVTLTCVVCLIVLAAGLTLAARALTAGELTLTVGGQIENGKTCVKVGCTGQALGCCTPGAGCGDHGNCTAFCSDCVAQELNAELGECQTAQPEDSCIADDIWCIRYKGGHKNGLFCTCNHLCLTTEQEDACIPPADPPDPPGP